MSANDLQQSLLNSIELLSQTAVDQDNAVKSIKATIVNIKDAGLNTYTISYGGNQFEASATNTSVKYQTGDIVYVLIPDGDFSQKKLIIGAVATRTSMYSSADQSNPYVAVSDNVLGTIPDISLKSWKNSPTPEDEPIELDEDFGLVFSEFLKKYKTVLFKANVRTDIDKDHQVKGNYGLRLILPFTRTGEGGETEEVSKVFLMDVNTMQGNPYAYNSEQEVRIYFSIEEDLSYDTSKNAELIPFVEGFDYLEDRTDIDYDIFIRNAGIQFMDVIPDSAKEGYYLSLVATKGNYFLVNEENASKTLTPVLKVNGAETAIDTWECYWLVEDTSIRINSDGYLPLAGQGWRCLNDKINISYNDTGKANFQYVLNKYTYRITDQDVEGSLRYKCILAQEDVVVSATVEIKNLKNNIDISLLTTSGVNVYPSSTGNINIIGRIYYPGVTDATHPDTIVTEWQRFDKEGNFLDDDFYSRIRVNDPVTVTDKQGNSRKVWDTEIQYPCSSLDQLNLINCTFYRITEINGDTVKKNLGTAQISLMTSENLSYKILVTNGDVVYKYDADGDSPLVANYDGPASSKVKNIIPISYQLFKDNGVELTADDYNFCKCTYKFPKNSMMEPVGVSDFIVEEDDDYYYIEWYGKKDLNYKIGEFFSKKKSNNTIFLTLEYAGNAVTEAINIKFLKDGESGTNGTKYAALINYNGFAYGERDDNNKLQKLQFVWVGGGIGWRRYDISSETLVPFGTPQLDIEIYKDGVRANSEDYSVTWDMFDSLGDSYTNKKSFSIDYNTGVLSVAEQWSTASDIYTNIVRAKVTINDGTDSTHYQELYVYYPIEVTRLVSEAYVSKLIPTLDGGFSEVLYATDGTNPAYDNSSAFVCTNNILEDASHYYDYTWDTSINLSIKEESDNEVTIEPVYKYDSGISKNYVRATIEMNVSQQSQLEEKIAEKESEISQVQKDKNYYDNVKQLVLDAGSSFDYENYLSVLTTSQHLLLYIFQAITLFNNLRDLKTDIIDYYEREDVQDLVYIDLNALLTEKIGLIDAEQTKIHNLIINGDLSSLANLSNAVILFPEDAADISVYYQIKTMIDRWNQLIGMKYLNIFEALTRQNNGQYVFQSQVTNLNNNLYNSLRSYITNYLDPLAASFDQRVADQEFVNLKTNVTNIVNRLTINNSSVNSYSEIDERVLIPIKNLLIIYTDSDYISDHYDDIISEYEQELENLETEKNGYDKAELPTTVNTVTHIKPIVMTLNRYEMSNLNGWDGNKLYTDSTNETYLFAPQVGAGKKESDNSFTGIVIGNRKVNNSSDTELGLFGYGSGVQTIFLDAETGNATFGSGNNTIELTPTETLIHFGDEYGKIYSGSHSSIGQTNPGFYLGHDGISIGSTFKVEEDGTVTMGSTGGGAVVIEPGQEPKIYTSQHQSVDSTNVGFYLGVDGFSIKNTFKVKEDGTVIIGSSGGCLTLDTNGIPEIYTSSHSTWESTGLGFFLGYSGLSIGSNFSVNGLTGALTTTNATITGGSIDLHWGSGDDTYHFKAGGSGDVEAWKITLTQYGNLTFTSGGHIYFQDSNATCGIMFPNNGSGSKGLNYLSSSYGLILITDRLKSDIVDFKYTHPQTFAVDYCSPMLIKWPYINELFPTSSGSNIGFVSGSSGYLGYGSSSSKEIKYDIKNVENKELDPNKLLKLSVKQFKYNLDYLPKEDIRYNKDIIGFIAEEVDKIYPIACDYNNGKPYNWNERYMIPAMLKLIQDQHKDIETLKQQIKEIKGDN